MTVPFVTEPGPAARRARAKRDRSEMQQRASLAKGIIAALLGVIILGFVLASLILGLYGKVAELSDEIVANRVIGCQRTLDLRLPLPDACQDPAVRHQLNGAP